MSDADVVKLLQPGSFVDPLTEVLRNGARAVNAGEKMYQRAGVKLHHRGVPNAPPEGFLLRDKQDEKRIASSANVPETSSVASPSVLPLPQSILRAGPSSPSES